jgi:SynChlorMet cassette protein ScmD
MTECRHPIANPSVVLREEFEDWAILYNPETADAVGINSMGVAIWKRMDGGRGIDAIVAEIQDAFDDVPDAAEEDISAFITDLIERGLAGYERERP